jgi:hypothetical protein
MERLEGKPVHAAFYCAKTGKNCVKLGSGGLLTLPDVRYNDADIDELESSRKRAWKNPFSSMDVRRAVSTVRSRTGGRCGGRQRHAPKSLDNVRSGHPVQFAVITRLTADESW